MKKKVKLKLTVSELGAMRTLLEVFIANCVIDKVTPAETVFELRRKVKEQQNKHL